VDVERWDGYLEVVSEEESFITHPTFLLIYKFESVYWL
jgi:hypothetical protein